MLIDYDIHGVVGLRLIDPSPSDAEAVSRQIGPLRRPLRRDPDIVVRFVDHLAVPRLQYAELNRCGFNEDGFFILQSKKCAAKVQVSLDQVGGRCELLCESGIGAVPLLMPLVNLTALAHGCAPLHASAFVYEGTGVLVTGWAKGGKTEALLAFANQGAKYVGDEWVLLRSDGTEMYGIPEYIRLWDWHIANLPHLWPRVSRGDRILFAGIHGLDRLERSLPKGRLGKTFPARLLREAMPALKRRLNVQFDPRTVFGESVGPFAARPDKLFLLTSHSGADISVEPLESGLVARRMAASVRYELLPFLEKYFAFTFGFPEKKNRFIEQAAGLHEDLLCRALAGKEAYVVRHPYPVSFPDLYKAMRPAIESRPRRPMEDGRGVLLSTPVK